MIENITNWIKEYAKINKRDSLSNDGRLISFYLELETPLEQINSLIESNTDITKACDIDVINNLWDVFAINEKILEYDYQSSEMWKLVDKSKFKDMPFFAKAAKGFIGLQGDHGEVWYRKIRIRNL